MILFMGGVRGAMPVTDVAYAQYGGDTTALMIEGAGGEHVLLDAGTGLRHVESRLLADPPGTRALLWLFTHFHLDHVMGFPPFKPLYGEEWTIEIASRVLDDVCVEDVLDSFIRPPLWPVAAEEMKAKLRYRILDAESMEAPSQYGGLTVRWCPLQHPGGSTAYRIDEPSSGASVVIATDVEWGESPEEWKEALRTLCATPEPAQVLLFDGQYSTAEYAAKRGWGHSTWQEGIKLAQHCGVKQLLITHHGPDMDDAACTARDAEIQAVWKEASLARQGVVLIL